MGAADGRLGESQIDGSVNRATGMGSAGGLIRGLAGDWIVGFLHNIVFYSVMEAELWGILDGLTVAWECGYRRVVVEVDNATVAQWCANPSEAGLDERNLAGGVRDLLGREWEIRVTHVFREANLVADALANLAGSLPYGVQHLENPPAEVQTWLQHDAAGEGRLRVVIE